MLAMQYVARTLIHAPLRMLCGGRRLAVTRAHLAPMHYLGARFPALRVLALSCIRDQPFTNSHSSVPQVVTSVSYTARASQRRAAGECERFVIK